LLTSYQEQDCFIYIDQIKALREHQQTTIYVDFQHLLSFDDTLALTISVQYFRMEPYLRKAIQSLVKEHDPAYLTIETGRNTDGESREFWLGWYGMGNVKKCFFLLDYGKSEWALMGNCCRFLAL
jgi:DNA replication licensing factor MCM6